eukprot:2354096-Prorocentrum_lima.AAC.1
MQKCLSHMRICTDGKEKKRARRKNKENKRGKRATPRVGTGTIPTLAGKRTATALGTRGDDLGAGTVTTLA